MFKPDHAAQVKRLYKLIMRTNRGLPPELRTMGDSYARDEFKRHKDAKQAEIEIFLREWTRYVNKLSRELKVVPQAKKPVVGKPLDPDLLDHMNDGQLVQLYELHKAAKDPDKGNSIQNQQTTASDDANTK